MSELDRLIRLRTGTGFRGYLLARHDDIVRTFGQPTRMGDGDKTDVEWIITTPHGVATIYNYKDGKVYLGDKGLDYWLVTEWHIGGKNTKSYAWIIARVQTTVIDRMR